MLQSNKRVPRGRLELLRRDEGVHVRAVLFSEGGFIPMVAPLIHVSLHEGRRLAAGAAL
jgi:hypothetical protein